MLIPAFSFHLHNAVFEGLVVVGKFDGTHPSLACGTSANKVILHSPHEAAIAAMASENTSGAMGSEHAAMAGAAADNSVAGGGAIRFLNMNRRISCMTAGAIRPPDVDGGVEEDDEADAAEGERGSRKNRKKKKSKRRERGEDGEEGQAVAGGNMREVLLVGSHTSLLAYDIEMNADLFFKDVPDGVNVVIFGKMPDIPRPLAVVGGNCSIQGFDYTGEEAYWTVTGDNVSAMAFCDVDEDGVNELLVGSEDYTIRVFQKEVMLSDVSEAEKVISLCPVEKTRYAYGLVNGTVGVYDGTQRTWRTKSKHRCTALSTFDLDGDGVPEVLCGWGDGGLDVRSDENGEIIYRDAGNGGAISGIVKTDYRMLGQHTEEVLVVSQMGEVRGYVPAQVALAGGEAGSAVAGGMAVAGGGGDGGAGVATALITGGSGMAGASEDDKALDELHRRKQELRMELRSLKANLAAVRDGGEDEGLLDPSTDVSYTLTTDSEMQALVLRLQTNNDRSVIVNAVVVDLEGGLFGGECETVAVCPANPDNWCSIALRPVKRVPVEVQVQVHVGVNASAQHLHVFEIPVRIPRFASFYVVDGGDGPSDSYRSDERTREPQGSVTFTIGEQVQKLVDWCDENFLPAAASVAAAAAGQGKSRSGIVAQNRKLSVKFASIEIVGQGGNGSGGAGSGGSGTAGGGGDKVQYRDEPLWIRAQRARDMLQVEILCDRMELAAEVVQDMSKFLHLQTVESQVEFPEEIDTFRDILLQVKEFNAARMRLVADIAGGSQRVKTLIVRAEDSRRIGDMPSMKEAYADLYGVNTELVQDYIKRSRNHQALLDALKEVNRMIQNASNLRFGPPKARVVTECRAAIKTNNVGNFLQIIQEGHGN